MFHEIAYHHIQIRHFLSIHCADVSQFGCGLGILRRMKNIIGEIADFCIERWGLSVYSTEWVSRGAPWGEDPRKTSKCENFENLNTEMYSTFSKIEKIWYWAQAVRTWDWEEIRIPFARANSWVNSPNFASESEKSSRKFSWLQTISVRENDTSSESTWLVAAHLCAVILLHFVELFINSQSH